MARKKNEAPKRVILTDKEADSLKERLINQKLTKKDISILLGLIVLSKWMQDRLSRAKLTMKRLRNLFGFSSESLKDRKKKKGDKGSDEKSKPKPENTPAAESDEPLSTTDEKAQSPQWDPKANHGRKAAADYTGCTRKDIHLEDEQLKSGRCPHCAESGSDAKVTAVPPTVLIFLDSRPLISGECYALEKVRCQECHTYFTAPCPTEIVDRPKYAPSCSTTLAIYHYYAGLPFKRIEMLQALQGIPLADATQYDLMNELYVSSVKPIADTLRAHAASGTSLFFDDTKGRILDQIIKNKHSKDKSAVHATALLSEYAGNRIYLFDTNTKPAGKQLKTLLNKRKSTAPFKTMSDASASNFPTCNENLLAKWIITLCLCHGRRRFIELFKAGDEEIGLILEIIANVYRYEKHCKIVNFTAEERLAYHKAHSEPLMESLKIWLNNLLLYQKVEPHSRFGEAITYLLKRWHWLTQFLRVPGAALDNNLCEQAIKIVIRYRHASLFYKTFYGATVGDAMMSVLHTAAHAGVNIFNYLNTLQEYAEQVNLAPKEWLPWNYQATLAQLEAPTETMAS